MADDASSWISALVSLSPLVVVAYFVWGVWALLYPMVPFGRGAWADARRGFERTTRSWLPSAARSSRYNVALCLELEGKLEEAEAHVRDLLGEPLDARLTYAGRSLLGTILVLRDHAPNEARALLDAAQREIPSPLGALLLAHAHLTLGDKGGAAQLVATSFTIPPVPKDLAGWKASLRFDPRIQSSMEAYFRGWYFHKVGDRRRARSDLEKAAQSPLSHVCVGRARALLVSASRPSFHLDEPPSSLSPHEL